MTEIVQLMARKHLNAIAFISTEQMVGRVQEIFSNFISIQFFMTSFAMAAVAAGAVAEDRQAGAMELYFARPLSRLDYALGKLLGAFIVPLASIIIPALLFWLIAVGITPPELRESYWGLLLPLSVGALLAALTLSTTIVGISALGQRATSVGVFYVGGLILISGVARGLFEAGQYWAGYLSPERNLRTVIDGLLEVGAPSIAANLMPTRVSANPDFNLSLLALALFILGGLLLLFLRLRREVLG